MTASPTTIIDSAATAERLLMEAGATRNRAFAYAPHIGLSGLQDGMFAPVAGPDPIDQIALIHQLGFTAIEDNFMKLRSEEEQRRIARELARRDMRLATFVASFETTGPLGSVLPTDSLTFASADPDDRAALIAMIEAAGEVARRFGGGWATVLSGRADPRLPRDYQTANVIENLKWAGDVAAKAGLTLGLEPINAREWTGTFVTTVPHGHLIVRGTDHPNVRLIFDAYHVQIETGSIMENLELAWDSIGYVQIADAPSRNEPGSGEINYASVLRRLKEKGFAGFVGLEHGSSVVGKGSVVESLRSLAGIDPLG